MGGGGPQLPVSAPVAINAQDSSRDERPCSERPSGENEATQQRAAALPQRKEELRKGREGRCSSNWDFPPCHPTAMLGAEGTWLRSIDLLGSLATSSFS